MKSTKKTLFLLLAFCLILSVFRMGSLPLEAAAAYTDSGRESVQKLSMDDLRVLYQSIPTVSAFYKTEPVLTGESYRTSVLTDTAYQNALQWINYYRKAAGLTEISFTDTLNESASWGALCLAMNDTLTHYPTKPDNMSQEDFEKASYATRTSNISYSYGYGIGNVLRVAVQGQIADQSAGNIPMLGHRRWLLNPSVLTMGIGSANNGSSYYTDIRVFGNNVSSQSVADYDFIAWPASGNNLSETFANSVPWSVTLNTSRYQTPSYDQVKVTLTRESDGRTWVFSKDTASGTTDSEDYFNINTDGYGVSNCIIFRPAYNSFSSYDGGYYVDIEGIYDSTGKAASLSYHVLFTSYSSDVGHDWDTENISWTWTGSDATGYTGAKAEFTCKKDGLKKSVTAEVTSVKTEATCTKTGTIVYTASVTLDGHVYTDKKTVTIPALGHDWDTDNITWEWSGSDDNGYNKATATFTCKRDPAHKETITAGVRTEKTEATCEKDGRILYTAAVTGPDGNTYTDTKTVVIPALGHKYGTPGYTWSNDNNEVTARVVCENDSSHIITETVKTAYKVTKEATCEKAGEGIYTATFENTLFTLQTKQVTIPAAGHDWDYDHVSWSWTGNDEQGYSAAAAAFTCTRDDSHVITANADVNKNTIDPSFKEDGEIVYTATVTGPDGKTYTDAKVIVIKKHVVTRLYGKGRYETSFLMADKLKETLGKAKFDTIIIACGTDFADALAGSYLAAVKEAPILLVGKTEKRISAVAAYVNDNLAEGGTVYILGGTSAVPEAMDDVLAGLEPQRLAGADRYETNVLILKEGGVKDGDEILVATGKDYPDSLSVSSVGKPILLVKSKLAKAQTDYLESLSNVSFTCVGGTSVVSSEMEENLSAYGALNDRIAGKNRFETSVLIAKRYFKDPETATLVYSHDYPDGLSAGAFAYMKNSPVILTRTKANSQVQARAYIQGLESVTAGYVIGGETLISDEAVVVLYDMKEASDIIVEYRGQ